MKLKEKAKILDKSSMDKTIERIAHEIIERFKSINDIAIIGIKSRGAYLGGDTLSSSGLRQRRGRRLRYAVGRDCARVWAYCATVGTATLLPRMALSPGG